ncbi:MAG TPA: hypothetical protein PLV51_01020 [Lentimicrobium sp.]|jgi:hypothetical protein|nr:hypothetical protein [Lentimicrobium sp.]
MKKFILLLFVLSMLFPDVRAQKPITFADDTLTFGNVEMPGIWVSIPEANLETIRKSWTKEIQKGTKSKPVTTANDVSIFGAIIKGVHSGPINIESRLLGQDTAVYLFAGVEIMRGEFATRGTREYDNLKKTLLRFAKDEYLKIAEGQLAAEEAKLKTMEKELSTVRKTRTKLDKKVQSANNSIAKENDNILSIQKQIKVKDEAIDALSTDLSLITEPGARKIVESELKKSQKEKKSLMKKADAAENRIIRSNDRIRDSRNSIDLNLQTQDQIGIRINEQKMVIAQYREKVKTIKSY